MISIDRAAQRLLRLAVRRWPAELREEQYREWSAELGYLRSQSGLPPVRRALAQLRYAFSLAVSPPLRDENRVPHGWRELLPRMGRRLWPVAALVGIGMGFRLMAGLVPSYVIAAIFGVSPGPAIDRVMLVAMIASGLVLIGGLMLAGWLGGVIGRRLALFSTGGTLVENAGSALLTVAALGTGILAIGAAQRFAMGSDGRPLIADAWLFTPLVWVIAFTPAVTIAVELTRRKGVWAGRIGGAFLGLVALDITAVPIHLIAAKAQGMTVDPGSALTWFFTVLVSADSMDFAMVVPATLVSAFALWYATTACRVAPPEPTVWVSPPAPARVFSRPRAAFGLSCVAVGLLTWAVAVAYATPAADYPSNTGDTQFLMWAAELRQSSILVVLLGLALALVGRGRPLPAAVGAGVLLIVVDTAFDAFDRVGWRGLVGALAVGSCVLAAAWWFGRNLLIAPPDALRVRRVYIGIAVVAAICAPIILFQATSPMYSSTPVVFPACTTVVTMLLGAVATVTAIAARPVRTGRWAAVAIVSVPVAMLGIAGALSGQPFNTGSTVFSVAIFGGLSCLPFAVFALAVMRWNRPKSPLRMVAIWLLIGLGSVVIDAITVVMSIMSISMVAASVLMEVQGTGYPADGSSVLPGMLVIAVSGAIFAAYQLAPAPRARPRTVHAVTRAVSPT